MLRNVWIIFFRNTINNPILWEFTATMGLFANLGQVIRYVFLIVIYGRNNHRDWGDWSANFRLGDRQCIGLQLLGRSLKKQEILQQVLFYNFYLIDFFLF